LWRSTHLSDGETVAKMGHPVLWRIECVSGGFGPRLDDAYYRNGERLLDVFESEGAGGVTGYDEEVGPLVLQKFCAGDGVAGDGLVGFGAVGEARGVAEIDIVRSGNEREQGTEDGEAAEAGVEDADGGIGI